MDAFLNALQASFSVSVLPWVLLGCLTGTLVGMLPGLGPITAIALMIPLSYSLDPAAGLIMMAGVYYGAVFGGSTSAILLNAPGVASTAATALDGYPMARAGQAGKALTIAAYASFAGGTLGTFALVLFAGSISALAVHIQSVEYCLLLLLALVSVILYSDRARRLEAAAMTVLGLMLATVGTDELAGVERFTLGAPALTDGIHLVVVVMGLFALGEALRMTGTDEQVPASRVRFAELMLPRGEVRNLAPVVGRSSAIGFLIGVLPGAGATLASFMAHDVEKRVGDGSREAGVAAPETANNAACSGSFVPLLTLGIPGSGTTAVLLGVMLAYGLQPGPGLVTDHPEVFWGVIASMYLGNLVLLGINLPLIPWLARVIQIPAPTLIPVVLGFAVLGTYLTTFTATDVGVMVVIAVAGLGLRSAGYPLTPLLLGYILGPLLEANARRTLLLAWDTPGYLLERPAALALLAVLTVTLVYPLRRWLGARRRSSGDVLGKPDAGG